jgi:hypothetical protein
LAVVALPKAVAPAMLKRKLTIDSPVSGWKLQHFDRRGVGAGIGDHAEFELGDAAGKILEPGRILNAGNLQDHPAWPFPRDRGFERAGRVDALAQDRDGLVHVLDHLLAQAGFGNGELDQPVRRFRD